MLYKEIDNNYIVNEGYLFQHKEDGLTCKMLRIGSISKLENYNIIPEPIEEIEEIEENKEIPLSETY